MNILTTITYRAADDVGFFFAVCLLITMVIALIVLVLKAEALPLLILPLVATCLVGEMIVEGCTTTTAYVVQLTDIPYVEFQTNYSIIKQYADNVYLIKENGNGGNQNLSEVSGDV